SQQNATCTDSDDGLNYNVKGKIINEKSNIVGEDFCSNSSAVGEYYCDSNIGNWKTFNCPSGICNNGVCVSALGKSCSVNAVSCNLEWKGPICGNIVNSANGYEELCNVPSPLRGSAGFSFQDDGCSITTPCPNGCLNGACVQSNQTGTCSALINEIKNPQDFGQDYVGGIKYTNSWNSTYNGSWWVGNNQREDYTEYDTSWNLNYQDGDNDRNGYVQKGVMIFREGFEAMSVLEQMKDGRVCQVHGYSDDNNDYRVYVCSWDIYNKGVNLDQYDYKNREILWANDNVLVRISIGYGKWLSDEELSKIIEKETGKFLGEIKDNQAKYVGWENFDINWPFSSQVYNTLNSCASDVPQDTCSPSWTCITEPAICPEHGYQTQTCKDYGCKSPDIVNQFSCNPGICSGCLVPKWFDSNSLGDNKCIPYGFRFENQISLGTDIGTNKEQDRIYASDSVPSRGDVNLIVNPDGTALLSVEGWKENYTLQKGSEYEINVEGWDPNIISLVIFVDDIVYNSEDYGKSYVDLTFSMTEQRRIVSTINSYCDIDGGVKVQRQNYPGESWPKCQNNYECSSNICSDGACVDVTSAIQQAGTFKKMFFQIFCRITNLFDSDGYNQCLYDNLGAQSSISGSGSSSGGSSGP
ncbi:MAG: hypothetical protein AABX48_02800, partial [Nanoarchaeota archaeon]